MAASPRYKVYDAAGVYQASAKEAEIAAGVAGLIGEGATVRVNHGRALWTEGAEGEFAADSVDFAARTIHDREAGLR